MWKAVSACALVGGAVGLAGAGGAAAADWRTYCPAMPPESGANKAVRCARAIVSFGSAGNGAPADMIPAPMPATGVAAPGSTVRRVSEVAGAGSTLLKRLQSARLKGIDSRHISALSMPNTFVLKFKSGSATNDRLMQLTAELRQSGLRPIYVEPSYRLQTRESANSSANGTDSAASPGDPFSVGSTDAWARIGTAAGTGKTIVAVIDSGVDYDHPALTQRMWTGTSGEHGRDVTPGAVNPADSDDTSTISHGTMVAGIIAADSSEPQLESVAGDSARIMAVRALSPDGTGCTDDLVNAVDYAIDPEGQVINLQAANGTAPDAPLVGATVVNMSLGLPSCSIALGEHLEWISQQPAFRKVLFVVAAPDKPNYDIDQASQRDYPASYGLPNILAVTGIYTQGEKKGCLSYAFGKATVDVAAPGLPVFSTTNNGAYGSASGTSFATPYVSGAAALLQQLAPPDWGFLEVKEYLLRSANDRMCRESSSGNYAATCANTRHPNVYWSLCGAVRTDGILDVDAATSPPLGQVTAEEYSSTADGTSVAVSWQLRSSATTSGNDPNANLSLCPTIDIDLSLDQGATVAAHVGGVMVADTKANITVPAALIPTGPAKAQVRLQCTGSHLFRWSAPFDLILASSR